MEGCQLPTQDGFAGYTPVTVSCLYPAARQFTGVHASPNLAPKAPEKTRTLAHWSPFPLTRLHSCDVAISRLPRLGS